MGILKHLASARRVTLGARTLVGRAESCAMRLASAVVSGEHAVLSWSGSGWSIRDLGSRNGTFLNGRKLGSVERVPVESGAVLLFGGDAERWTMEDIGPPIARARGAEAGDVRAAEDGLLALPDAADPRATLSLDRNGLWVLELDGAARPAIDGEILDLGQPWTICIPCGTEGTPLPTTASGGASDPKLSTATHFRFDVSRDEEFVSLSLVHGGKVTSLGGRAHHEVLLALARARLRDAGAGVPPLEQGWIYVEDLLSMLRLDLHHFNVNVFRARQQLARAGMIDVGALVERRSTTRQVRLGTANVEVHKP